VRTVAVKDFGLYRALSEVVGRHLTAEALAGVTDLSWDEYRAEVGPGHWQPIDDLSGIQHCVNLRGLHLDGNNLRSLLPLAGLTRLSELWLVGNDVSNLKPLAGLTELTTVVLEMNRRLTNVAPLAGLRRLEYLNLVDTGVRDLSPLTDLPALTRLAWRPYTMYGRKPVAPAVMRRAEDVLATLRERGVTVERYQPAAP
jgi:hypothetical protein